MTMHAHVAAAEPARLSDRQLRLAISCAILDRRYDARAAPGRRDGILVTLQAALCREDPEDVASAYDAYALRGLDNSAAGGANGKHGRLAERVREMRRPMPYRRRDGITVPRMAEVSACRLRRAYSARNQRPRPVSMTAASIAS